MINLKVLTLAVLKSTIIFLLVCFFHFIINSGLEIEINNHFWKSYIFSFVFLLLFFCLFFFLQKNFLDHLGFLYLFWIFIKFITMFTLFKSEINNDLETKKEEIIILLIPYLLGIFLSIFHLNKTLTKED